MSCPTCSLHGRNRPILSSKTFIHTSLFQFTRPSQSLHFCASATAFWQSTISCFTYRTHAKAAGGDAGWGRWGGWSSRTLRRLFGRLSSAPLGCGGRATPSRRRCFVVSLEVFVSEVTCERDGITSRLGSWPGPVAPWKGRTNRLPPDSACSVAEPTC